MPKNKQADYDKAIAEFCEAFGLANGHDALGKINVALISETQIRDTQIAVVRFIQVIQGTGYSTRHTLAGLRGMTAKLRRRIERRSGENSIR